MIIFCYKNGKSIMIVFCYKDGKSMMPSQIIIKIKFVHFSKDEFCKLCIRSHTRSHAMKYDYRFNKSGVIIKFG